MIRFLNPANKPEGRVEIASSGSISENSVVPGTEPADGTGSVAANELNPVPGRSSTTSGPASTPVLRASAGVSPEAATSDGAGTYLTASNSPDPEAGCSPLDPGLAVRLFFGEVGLGGRSSAKSPGLPWKMGLFLPQDRRPHLPHLNPAFQVSPGRLGSTEEVGSQTC